MNINKTINTVKSCNTHQVRNEIKSCIMKAQKLNEKMQQYVQTITQYDDVRENILVRPRDTL